MRYTVPRWKLVNSWLFLVYYVLVSIIFFKIFIFHTGFVNVVNKIGFYFEFSLKRFIIATIVVSVSSLVLLTSRQKDFIYSVLSLIILFFLIPSAIVYASSKQIDGSIFMFHFLFFVLTFLFSKIRVTFADIAFKPEHSIKILLPLIILAMLPLLKYVKYINLNNLFLKDIYKTREIFQEVSSTYLSYSYSWLNKYLIPVLFIFYLHYKKKIMALFCFGLLIYLFLLGAHKSVLYGSILSLILYRFTYQRIIRSIILILILVSVASLMFYFVFNNDLIVNYTLRRAPFLPAILDLAYFDFFKGVKLYWAESKFNPFLESPLDVKHGNVIANQYFNRPDMNANNGIISSGFMNAGNWGVLINIVITAIYFSLFNQFKISSKFFPLVLLLFVSIMSSALTTILLTHGGGVFLIVAFLFMRNTEETLV